jgi:hypothetical protein
MQLVTSTHSVEFPKLAWAITAGEVVELPADKEAQAQILAHPDITPVVEKRGKLIED